jgi:hypothetical protein
MEMVGLLAYGNEGHLSRNERHELRDSGIHLLARIGNFRKRSIEVQQ